MLTFGSGLLNSTINNLPFEVHLPGYQYCGPGTRLQKRLARRDPGINLLDAACKEHDIAYSQHKNLKERHEADKILGDKAWLRAKTSSSIKERLAALAVTGAMKTKTKLGLGLNKKPHRKKVAGKGIAERKKVEKTFREAVSKARMAIRPIKDINTAIKVALSTAKNVVKNHKGNLSPRIIPVPKTGGFLPLIPLFAGLSALGALAGGAAGVAKAVNDASAAKQQLREAERHNKTLEAVALQSGKGFYLRPYRKGYGLALMPKNCQSGR